MPTLRNRVRKAQTMSVSEAEQDALGQVAGRLVRLLRRERQLLDREIEPDRERQARTECPRRRCGNQAELPSSAGMLTQVRDVEVRDRADPQDSKRGEREERDEHREAESRLDAPDVETDEHDVAQKPPDRLEPFRRLEDRAEIAAGEEHHDRGREHVFHVLGEAGDEPAPRSHGRAPEGVGAAGVRQRRRHLGDRVAQSEIEHGDDDRGDRTGRRSRRRRGRSSSPRSRPR